MTVAQMRLRRGVAALATAVACLTAGAAFAPPAQAHTATLPAWQPFRSSAFVQPAGDPCPFPVAGTPVRDEEEFRTLATYADGDPQLQQFRGPLLFRYTNQSTGRSVLRDLSGRAAFHYGRDGSLQAFFLDNGGVTVHPGNVGFPVGEWIFHGPFALNVDPAGNREIYRLGATAENLCTTLAHSRRPHRGRLLRVVDVAGIRGDHDERVLADQVVGPARHGSMSNTTR